MIGASTRDDATPIREGFADTRWRAARHGLVLDRTRGFLGSVYTLASLDEPITILYDLPEVNTHLDRLAPSRF